MEKEINDSCCTSLVIEAGEVQGEDRGRRGRGSSMATKVSDSVGLAELSLEGIDGLEEFALTTPDARDRIVDLFRAVAAIDKDKKRSKQVRSAVQTILAATMLEMLQGK